jgi:hypothetical protein
MASSMIKAIDLATNDNAEGAEERAMETSYIWTSLRPEDYRPTESKTGTVADGMEKTGGYVGTDLDQEDSNI